jgi:hypothetical protein
LAALGHVERILDVQVDRAVLGVHDDASTRLDLERLHEQGERADQVQGPTVRDGDRSVALSAAFDLQHARAVEDGHQRIVDHRHGDLGQTARVQLGDARASDR